jgi:NADH-quinone oxidoreductase subunit N
MATAVKLAAFAGMIRVFICAFYSEPLRGMAIGAYGWIDLAWCFAICSMVLGNLCAITQKSIKRMLAYSSIAHAGYLLVGFVAANSAPEYFLYNDAILFYLATYTFGTLGAFGVLAYLSKNGANVETYDDIAGVGLKFPMVGLVMAICMLSSAGIPPTAGFLGKFYVFRAAVDAGFVGTTICALMTSIAGVYYYLKVLVFMYMKPVQVNVTTLPFRGASFALVVSAVLTIYLGILPGRALDLTRQSVLEIAGVPQVLRPIQEAGRAAQAKSEAVNSEILVIP